jgi:PAS domain S-box-containing protein
MRNAGKTKQHPINELVPIHPRIAELEASEAERRQTEEALRASEEKYRHLFENLNDAALLADAETGQILETNRQGEVLFGRSRNEIAGMHQSALHPPGKAEEYKQRFAAHVAKGHAADYEGEVIRRDGTIIPVIISASPLTINGYPLILGIFRDITKRKQAEEALRENEEKLHLMFESAGEGIVVIDLDNKILDVNQAMVRMHGYDSREELIGRNALDLCAEEDRARASSNTRRRLEKGLRGAIEYTLLRKDGSKFPAEVNMATIRDAHGIPIGFIGIFVDITKRKQAEEALQESQEALRQMFESVSDGISVINLNGVITEVNQRTVEMHGFSSRDELLGRSAFDLVAPCDHERIATNMRKALKEGTIKDVEYTLLKANGSEFPGELSTSVLKDASGNQVGHITIARDITKRKQAEELFKTLANSSPVGIYIVQDGKFQLANPQFQKLTGYTEDELVGTDSLALVLAQDRHMVREKAVKMLKGEHSFPYQFRVVNKTGETRWVMETVTSIQYRGRQATLGNYIDVTERKQAEEERRELEQKAYLASRLASVGEMASGIAHEINNPLTAVIGFAQLLMDANLPDEVKEDIGVIYEEAQRAAGVAKNLLTFARKHPPVKQLTNINSIIDGVLKLRTYEQKVNNIKVNTRFTPKLPEVMADYSQLEQVFINIIINAETAMLEANKGGTLSITTQRVNDTIRALFTDDGPGITKENLEHVFDPFFTTKEVGKGTGLGLSVCHGIVVEHGGRIYARSKSGKGATFVVELPINAH